MKQELFRLRELNCFTFLPFSVHVDLQIFDDTIKGALNSQAENLNTCSVQILDSTKKIVKTIPFPKAIGKAMMKQYTKNSIPISELARGNYTCLIFLGKEEMYKKAFYKDK